MYLSFVLVSNVLKVSQCVTYKVNYSHYGGNKADSFDDPHFVPFLLGGVSIISKTVRKIKKIFTKAETRQQSPRQSRAATSILTMASRQPEAGRCEKWRAGTPARECADGQQVLSSFLM